MKSTASTRSSARSALARYGPSILVEAWRYSGLALGRHRRRVLAQPFIAVALAAAETLGLLAVLRLLLALLQGDDATTLTSAGMSIDVTFRQLAGVALASGGAAAALRIAEARVTARTAALAVTSARRHLVEAWFGADWESLRSERLGTLQQLVAANSQQAGLPVIFLGTCAVSVLSLVIYGVGVIAAAPVVGLVFLAIAIGTSTLFAPFRRLNRQHARSSAAALGELHLAASSYSSLSRELAVFRVGHHAAADLASVATSAGEHTRRLRLLSRALPGVYQQLLLGSVVIAVLIVEGIGTPPPAFGTAAILGVRSISYLQQLNTAAVAFMEGRPYLAELFAVLEKTRAQAPRDGSKLLSDGVQDLRLERVTYRYDESSPVVLGPLNLQLRQGDRVGIVGPSGSGKTTLVNMLVGLLTPTTGRYLVNEEDAQSYRRSEWASHFALVSQEPVLLRGTIAENIAFYRECAREDIVRAADTARIRREVEELPDGFDTLVGEGAMGLSGGQRQRIAIARSLLASPECLVLDEPTSALDAANEELIEESLRGIPEHTIVVLVTHRPRLLKMCTRILSVAEGAVQESLESPKA